MGCRMKIFISGKITGVVDYKKKFDNAEKLLKHFNHSVMNPAVLPLGFEYNDYMSICLEMLKVCNGIYMLTGWQFSEGAKTEWKYAKKMHMKIMYEVLN